MTAVQDLPGRLPSPTAPVEDRLARAVGPGVPLVVGAVAATLLLVRVVDAGGLSAAGPWVLVVAVLVGLPHGAVDAALLASGTPGAGGRTVAAAAGYLALAAAAFLLWSRWPDAAVGALLVVSATHFAGADHATLRWYDHVAGVPASNPGLLSAAVSGAVAVAGPFAFWPANTARLLARLDVDATGAAAVTAVSRVVVVVAALLVLGGLVATYTGGAQRSVTSHARARLVVPAAALVALTAAAPPLVAFAIYFAVWHTGRQMARLCVLYRPAAQSLATQGIGVAARRLVGAAAVPTAGAVVVLAAVVFWPGERAHDLTAGLLAALLAVSVPHSLVVAWRERAAELR